MHVRHLSFARATRCCVVNAPQSMLVSIRSDRFSHYRCELKPWSSQMASQWSKTRRGHLKGNLVSCNHSFTASHASDVHGGQMRVQSQKNIYWICSMNFVPFHLPRCNNVSDPKLLNLWYFSRTKCIYISLTFSHSFICESNQLMGFPRDSLFVYTLMAAQTNTNQVIQCQID